MPHKRLITRILQRYWRLTRGLTLEVRACAQDASGRVLLVRESAAMPWRLPGGPVLQGETAAMAVQRWLEREGQLAITADPRLASVLTRTTRPGGAPRSDQIALYLVLSWREIGHEADTPDPTRAFFAADALPGGLDPATVDLIAAANDARVAPQVW